MRTLSWPGIFRLALVQTALGAVVVLVTSTLNRVMVVEYSLPALLPGSLVALHYAVQMVRPRFGFGSDVGGRRTPWVMGGMAVLAGGGFVSALATVWMPRNPILGSALAAVGYGLVGLGAGAAGTSLLVLMASLVDARRRAAAASIMWILMIAGFAVTSTVLGHFLDPFSPRRLLLVAGSTAAIALSVACLAVWNVEPRGTPSAALPGDVPTRAGRASFADALRCVWDDPHARRFTLFVFVSMLAYSAEELLIEPFCGLVLRYSLGESARVAGLWHGGVFAGMVAVGLLCSSLRRLASLRAWTMGGCCASAAAVAALAACSLVGPDAPVKACIFVLGLSNGVFAVSAIGSMMELAPAGGDDRIGVRMGLWGAAQAVAFALGGILGTGSVDAVRFLSGSAALAFAVVFGVQAAAFVVAARFAARVAPAPRMATTSTAVTA